MTIIIIHHDECRLASADFDISAPQPGILNELRFPRWLPFVVLGLGTDLCLAARG